VSSKPIIVLGASARAAAQSVIRAGMSAYAIDCFADQDLTALCPTVKIDRYPHGFTKALAAAPEGTWLYTGGLENYPRLVDRLAAIRPLAGNPGAILRRVRDQNQLALTTSAAGCSTPREAKSERWLVKPKHGSGGTEIRFATGADLENPPRHSFLQPFIEGEARSAVYVAARGQATFLGVTRQLLGHDFQLTRPFLYVGSLGPVLPNLAELQSVSHLGNVLADQFSLTGLFNVDYVSAAGKIWPLEVNPRYSASIEVLERATGFTTIGPHLAACAGARLLKGPQLISKRFAGKAVVYAQRDGVIPNALGGLIADMNQPGEPPLVSDLPRLGEPVRKDQPVLTVFAEAASLAGAEARLRQRVDAVKEILSR
jgi:uncharacterized protein